MNHYYIFDATFKDGRKICTATVIFCPGISLDVNQLQEELKNFYVDHFQTDKTVVIGGSYIENFANIVIEEKEKIFKYVPTIERKTFFDNLHLISFGVNGVLVELQVPGLRSFDNIKNFKKVFLNQGLTKVFVSRGGLVEATGSHHHYSFPSGRKHSDRFLRVANVLLYSSEIYFVAFSLLKYFKHDFYKEICCDTSSINSIAIALTDLVNRFLNGGVKTFPVNSFKSYQGLYSGNVDLKHTSFILISASTSGNILEYILSKNAEVRKDNIVVLFYLDNSKHSKVALEQVVCNLTRDDFDNPYGIERFKSYEGASDCVLCARGSHPVEISGDVFLLESPKINSIRIDANDMDVRTSSLFINQFMSLKGENSVLKVNYKETGDNSERKYEIYIDYSYIIENIDDKRFQKHKEKLDAYIDQHIPSNLRYILSLNDQASEKLARYIFSRVGSNYMPDQTPVLKNQDQFAQIDRKKVGSILIVGSCITNGKNLLYLSRALRDYKLRIVYFIGINRPNNELSYRFLKTNLKYGKYGPDNSSFIEIDKIHCSNLSEQNAWQVELDFLKKQLSNVDDRLLHGFIKKRISSIEDGYSNFNKGMYSNLFLPRLKGNREMPLKIRRNSAFFNKEDYASHVSQSDVFFNISYVLNQLRNSENSGHTLRQSTFVRNLVAPENLNRFNDGIIQASILRGATKDELNFSIDDNLSRQLKDILITIFKYRSEDQGEALLEFLYAIAIKKLTMKEYHLDLLLQTLDADTNYLIKFYVDIIEAGKRKETVKVN